MIETPAYKWQAWWRARAATDDRVIRAAAEQGFVLSIRQLSRVGISRDKVRTRLVNGGWTVTGTRGVAAPLPIIDGADPFLIRRRRHALECAAAALAHPGHVVSGRSAAILHELPTLHIPRRPELTGPVAGVLGRRTSTPVFGARLRNDERTEWFGVPVTTVARSVVDVARHERRGGLVVADAALHDQLADRDGVRLAIELPVGPRSAERVKSSCSRMHARSRHSSPCYG